MGDRRPAYIVGMSENKSLGQVAYEGWCARKEWVSNWDDMTTDARYGWTAVAEAVVRDLFQSAALDAPLTPTGEDLLIKANAEVDRLSAENKNLRDTLVRVRGTLPRIVRKTGVARRRIDNEFSLLANVLAAANRLINDQLDEEEDDDEN